MSKIVTLLMAVLLIGFVVVGMYAYTQTANLDKWGDYQPLIELSPILAAAALGAGGVLVYAFVRRGRM